MNEKFLAFYSIQKRRTFGSQWIRNFNCFAHCSLSIFIEFSYFLLHLIINWKKFVNYEFQPTEAPITYILRLCRKIECPMGMVQKVRKRILHWCSYICECAKGLEMKGLKCQKPITTTELMTVKFYQFLISFSVREYSFRY